MVSSKRLDLGIGWELPMAFAHEDRPAVKFFRGGSKPYVRWWWLAGPFCERDIETQLTWVKQMGFGGAIRAFVKFWAVIRLMQGERRSRPGDGVRVSRSHRSQAR